MRLRNQVLQIAIVFSALCGNGFAQEASADPFDVVTPAGGFAPETALADSATNILQIAHEDGGEYTPRLFMRFDDGFTVFTEDEEFEFRIKLMQQTDAKLFLPEDQEPARPGLYIPRFRAYFEGHITQTYEYELSLQRSVEGEFDVLDANIKLSPC